TEASGIRGALVACTGNTGCKFSATDTKGQAAILAEHLDRTITLDQPINIHLTGCPHSCAQHLVADIGLLGGRIGDDAVEGYHVRIGGSAAGAGDQEQKVARDLWRDVPFAELPGRVERLLRVYLRNRRDAGESFHAFAGRHQVEDLTRLCHATD